jgi:hypothetical protein
MQQRAVQLELEAGRIRDAMEQAAAERGTLSPGWGTMRDVPQDVQQSLGPRLREIGEQLSALRLEQQRARDGLRGHMYEVELGVPKEALLDLDAPVLQQSQEIIAALGPYAEAPRHFTFGQDGWRGKNAYMAAAPVGFGDAMRQASRRLMKGGIPGLRYLDGNSRTAGQGTHNYVMFPGTEDRIRILRQYGLLAPMALPAMSEE